MQLTALIEALGRPAAYPHPVDKVEVHQTHISVVFLAGRYAYKVKKPVRPGFLDFSTLDKRRHFCEEEVRLNRRLAPHIYRGVVPVTAAGGSVRVEGEGEPIEWAVRMVRLPAEATLQERLRRGEVGAELADSLGRRVASFHQKAAGGETVAALGRLEAVSRNVLDVLEQAAPQVGSTVSEAVYGRLKQLTEESLGRLGPLIEARAARGVPRDCHGDLHLDHVYYFPERAPPEELVIIDCIEFTERFRFIDPVADMAFLAMDFAWHGRRDLACAFTEAYFRAAGDDEGRALLPLYISYRAAVRGCVDGMKQAESEVPGQERAAALVRARGHWLLALDELEEPCRRPCLLLVGGLPGTGKSTLARALAERAGFKVIRSDVVRKQEGRSAGEILYSPVHTAWTYAACLDEAQRSLFEGKRVLLDATFREERFRREAFATARDWGVRAGLLVCTADPETVRRRLEQRRNDVSDADWAVYLQLAGTWEEPGTLMQRQVQRISAEGVPEHAIGAAIEVLRLWGMF